MFTELLARVAEVATAPHGVDRFVAPLRPRWGDALAVPPGPGPVVEAGEEPAVVFLAGGSVARPTTGGETVLELAEASGLAPRFGCRRGVCRRCTRPKVSGVVRDLRTGLETGPQDEPIQICVSVPTSVVVVDL